MKPIPALAELYGCYYGHPHAVTEAWEPAERYYEGKQPNRVGCHKCGRMVRIDWSDTEANADA